MSDENVTSSDGVEHDHEVGDVLEKVDTSEWKVTNRMVDVDTDEVLYRLREVDQGFLTRTEILSESQVSRSFDVGDVAEDTETSREVTDE